MHVVRRRTHKIASTTATPYHNNAAFRLPVVQPESGDVARPLAMELLCVSLLPSLSALESREQLNQGQHASQ
jgi:hypothetical protein